MAILPRILYDNQLIGATLTATKEDTGFPVENLIDWRDYVRWSGTGDPNYVIHADCGSAISATAFALAGHNLKTRSATVLVEASSDDSNWVEIVSLFSPADDNPLAVFFAESTYQYWRVTIEGSPFATEIGVLFIGNYLEMPQPPEIGFDPDSMTDHCDRSIGGGGRLLGVVNEWTERKQEYSFKFLSQSWVKDTWLPFWNDYRFQPIIWVWDSVGHGTEVHYGYFNQSDMTVPYDGYFRQPLKLTISGIVE